MVLYTANLKAIFLSCFMVIPVESYRLKFKWKYNSLFNASSIFHMEWNDYCLRIMKQRLNVEGLIAVLSSHYQSIDVFNLSPQQI